MATNNRVHRLDLNAYLGIPQKAMLTVRDLLRPLHVGGAMGVALLLSAQADTWTRKNDVAYNGWDGPSIGLEATTFSIGDRGYVIGRDSTLWAYDPANDSWTARARFPDYVLEKHVSFSIGGRGYVCRLSAPVTTWEYDPVDDTWTTKAPFPGAPRTLATGFTLNGKGYAGTGRPGIGPLTALRDLWEFDPVLDTWTQKTDLVGGLIGASGFAAGDLGYIVCGYSASGDPYFYNSTYAYDPVTDSWTQRADYPWFDRGRWHIAFGIGGKGFMGCGTLGSGADRTLYEYDPPSNTWIQRASFGASSGRSRGFAMAIGGKGYIGGGWYYGNYVMQFNDFWEYDPSTLAFRTRQYLGGMEMGNCAAMDIGGKILFAAGSWSSDLVGTETWNYDPVNDQWLKQPDIGLNSEASSTFSLGGKAYKSCGFRYSSVFGNRYESDGAQYDPQTQSWTGMAAMSGGMRGYAVGCSALGKGYVGLGTNDTPLNDWWQYDPIGNMWTQRANFPGTARQGAVTFRIGSKLYVGTGLSTGTTRHKDMWEYDPTNDTWTQRADFGGTARHGAVAFAIGDKGYITTGDDGTKRKDLWEYDAVSDTWTQRSDLPGVGRSYAFAAVIGSTAYVGSGFTTARPARDMWAYTPTDVSAPLQLRPRVLLDGPWDPDTELMSDALRTNGLVPLMEPYTRLGYAHATSGGEQIPAGVLAVNGNDAIVDWVMVELRRADRPDLVVASASALLQCDGDVVGLDGSGPVDLHAPPGTYHVAIKHRNHLGVMTSAPTAFSTSPLTVDHSSPSSGTYGTDARRMLEGKALLWCGDVTTDGRIMYTGTANDRDRVLAKIGGTVPTNVVTNVYSEEDVDLDGRVLYTGSGNDRDRILQSIGGSIPTTVRTAQLP